MITETSWAVHPAVAGVPGPEFRGRRPRAGVPGPASRGRRPRAGVPGRRPRGRRPRAGVPGPALASQRQLRADVAVSGSPPNRPAEPDRVKPGDPARTPGEPDRQHLTSASTVPVASAVPVAPACGPAAARSRSHSRSRSAPPVPRESRNLASPLIAEASSGANSVLLAAGRPHGCGSAGAPAPAMSHRWGAARQASGGTGPGLDQPPRNQVPANFTESAPEPGNPHGSAADERVRSRADW